ncbi:hypothetical protein AeRB84_015575 [Aphanomyces euteiches]|nr:hypothetical protein AeRB84_015575 [Aphanomyces euteiches]
MDKYKKLERIGKGSFGAAYLVAKRGDSSKRFVIKEIQIDPRDQKAALREARLLAALDHPNIIACKEHFTISNNRVLCIVTEYADGGDLRRLLKQYITTGHRMSENQILDLLVQICLALKHVHDRKILHRDIKPENIFLMQSRVVKLGDFGVAKVLSNTMACADTQTGTPYYTSPEICHGLKYNHKTDVWSLGCVLYEMITQTHAFDGRNQKQLFQNIAYSTYDSSRLETCTPALKKLVMDMLAKTPRDRPSVNAILKLPLLRDRIETFLSAREMQKELAHTVLHGQHLFRKAKAITSPRSMKQPPPPPPPIAIVHPVVKERQPVVRGYAAPTAAMKQRVDAMAAKKERVQALVAKQRKLLQDKKAKIKDGIDPDKRNERPAAALRNKSPPKSAPEPVAANELQAEAKRQQHLDEQAVRDLPVMPPPAPARNIERDRARLKMAEDIKEKKRLLKANKQAEDAVILVQAIKANAPVSWNHPTVPKVEAIIAPDTIVLSSTVGSPVRAVESPSFKEDPRPTESCTVNEDDEPLVPAFGIVDENELNDLAVLEKPNLEYERMVLQMKSIVENANDEVEDNDDDADDRNDAGNEDGSDKMSSNVRLSQLALLQTSAFKNALKSIWHGEVQFEEMRETEMPALTNEQMEEARWLCAYMQAVTRNEVKIEPL